MPPLKEFIYIHMEYRVIITIEAYNLEGAYNKLVQTTKHPSDYKLTNTP